MTKKNLVSFLRLAATSLLVAAAAGSAARAQFVAAPAADEWRAWRGPHGNGVAAEQAPPPTEFSPSENIVWKSIVPGRGHSSPIIVGDLVLLTSADESSQVQSVLAYGRSDGKGVWKRDLHQRRFSAKIHGKNTHASPTLASDGQRIYAVFNNDGGVHATALSLDGKVLWQQRVGDYLPQRYKFGYAPSPVLYKDLLIIASEFESGYLAALNTEDGKRAWMTPRPNQISFSSPIIGHTSGRDQLLLSGAAKISSFDPASGKLLWATDAVAPATCGTLVWNEDMVFASGGYPKKETAAVLSDGSGKVVWRNQEKCYEQSMLYHNQHLYAVNDNGIAICWAAATGEEKWKQRLPGGAVSSSPTLVNDVIYVANEAGTVYVYKADPNRFTPIAKNQMGDEAFASPTIVGGRIYLRTASRDSGTRVETLYCIGRK